MSPHLQTILSELRERLEAHYGERLERLVLFGSHARGDAEPDSNIDVLVVLKGEVNPYDEMVHVRDIADDISLRTDTVIACAFVSSDRYQREESPLLMNVRKEGVGLRLSSEARSGAEPAA